MPNDGICTVSGRLARVVPCGDRGLRASQLTGDCSECGAHINISEWHRHAPPMETPKVDRYPMIGLEMEFDPAGNEIDRYIRNGGVEANVGLDGASNTIEVRTEPFPISNPRGYMAHIACLMHELTSHQPPQMYGGSGRRVPVGMHVHVDSLDANKVKHHFYPLWCELIARSDTTCFAKRVQNGYGMPHHTRQQSNGRKAWTEYRGLPTPPSPMLLGFCIGWASLLFKKNKGASMKRLMLISKAAPGGMGSLDSIRVHDQWTKSGTRPSPVAFHGYAERHFAQYSHHLRDSGIRSIHMGNLNRGRAIRWLYCNAAGGLVYETSSGPIISGEVNETSDIDKIQAYSNGMDAPAVAINGVDRPSLYVNPAFPINTSVRTFMKEVLNVTKLHKASVPTNIPETSKLLMKGYKLCVD